ncbi:MAG: hypothetical protein ABUL72_02800, partial [Armatimonadota bacterium]
VPEGGDPDMHCGEGTGMNLSWNAGRFKPPKLNATGKLLSDGSYEFEFPAKWTKGKDSVVGVPVDVGDSVGALVKLSRGTLIPTAFPQDTFKIRMTAEEVQYLKGGRFSLDLWLETRKMVTKASLDKALVCEESEIWTKDAALTRSDELTHAGE